MKDQDQGHAPGPVIIAKLLKKMDADRGFVGVSGAVGIIKRLTDESEPRKLTAALLHDPMMTAKLMQAANAGGRGSRNVSTIDQAINILGLNRVISFALALPALSKLSNQTQMHQLEAETVAAYYCGLLAAQITRHYGARYNAQEAQICALMQNLGRMMAILYLYADIERSRTLQADKNLSEDEAISETLGVTFEEIGLAIAQHWNLPDVLLQCLTPNVGKVPPRASPNALGWHQLCSMFARRITDAMFRLPEGRERMEINQNLNFFHRALSLRNTETQEWIDQALQDTDTILAELGFPCNVESARVLLRKASERVLDTISSQDSLTKAGADSDAKKPIDLIHQALRMIHSEYSFDLTLLCLPSGSSGLVAVSGVGRNANQVTPKFRCGGPKPDIFQLIASKKADMFIADVHNPSYAKLIPDWYPSLVGAESLMVSSLVHEDKFLGLLYGDYSLAHPDTPHETNEGAGQKWREQLIAALLAGKPH
jgi:HD-like signal output (HDOD) protein